MKTFRQLCFSVVLITLLVAPSLGGETQTPPGETHTPPAALGITEMPPVAPGETHSPPASGHTQTPPAIALLMYLVRTWL